MKKLLLVPALLLAACGDNLQPDEQDVATGAAQDEADAPAADATVTAALVTEPNDCADHSLRFRAFALAANGETLENPICRVEFADGTTVESCFFTHSVSTAGETVVLTVIDPATGATDRHEELLTGPSFDPRLDVSSGGLWIAWSIEAEQGVDYTFVDFDPIENVIVQDPNQQGDPFGVVQVTQAGTYTVTALAVRHFGDILSCPVTLVKTVEVACTDEHVQ
jgi:hypothetical protein